MQQNKDIVITFPPHAEEYYPQQGVCSKCGCLKGVPDNYKNLNKSCSSMPAPLTRHCPDIHAGREQQHDDRVTALVRDQKNHFHAETMQVSNSDLEQQIIQVNQNVTFQGKRAPDCKNSSISQLHPVLNTTVEIPERQQFRSTVVQWVQSGHSSQTKTILDIQKTPTSSLPLKSMDDSMSSRKLQRHRNSTPMAKCSKLQWLYITCAWLTTACGIGIYLYVLTATFNGNRDILSKNFALILIASNVSLLSAVYFHRKIRKILL